MKCEKEKDACLKGSRKREANMYDKLLTLATSKCGEQAVHGNAFRDKMGDTIMAVLMLYIQGKHSRRSDLNVTVDVLVTWESGPPSSCRGSIGADIGTLTCLTVSGQA